MNLGREIDPHEIGPEFFVIKSFVVYFAEKNNDYCIIPKLEFPSIQRFKNFVYREL